MRERLHFIKTLYLGNLVNLPCKSENKYILQFRFLYCSKHRNIVRSHHRPRLSLTPFASSIAVLATLTQARAAQNKNNKKKTRGRENLKISDINNKKLSA